MVSGPGPRIVGNQIGFCATLPTVPPSQWGEGPEGCPRSRSERPPRRRPPAAARLRRGESTSSGTCRPRVTRDDGILDRSRRRGYGIARGRKPAKSPRRWGGPASEPTRVRCRRWPRRSVGLGFGARGAARTPASHSTKAAGAARPLRLVPRARSLPGHRDHRPQSFLRRDHHRGLDVRGLRQDPRQGTEPAPAGQGCRACEGPRDLQRDPVRHEVHYEGAASSRPPGYAHRSHVSLSPGRPQGWPEGNREGAQHPRP